MAITTNNEQQKIEVTNLSNSVLSIGDLPFVPTIRPGEIVDLLRFHPRELIEQSKALASLVDAGTVSVDRQQPASGADDFTPATIEDAFVPGEFRSDQFATLQAALDAANAAGGGTVLVSQEQNLTVTINMENMIGVYLVGIGMGNINTLVPTGHSILRFEMASNLQPCISMVGAHACGISNISVYSPNSTGNRPSVGILMGRNDGGSSAGFHTFTNINISGYFLQFCLANLGSEVNRYSFVKTWNWQDGGNGVFVGRYNVFDFTSPFSTIVEDHVTCTDIKFDRCFFGVYGQTASETNIIITPAVHSVFIESCDFSNKSSDLSSTTLGGKAAIHFDYVDDAYIVNSSALRIRGIYIRDCLWETSGAKNAVLVETHISGLTIQNVRMEARESTVKFTRTDSIATSDTTLRAFDIIMNNNDFVGNKGTYVWDEGSNKPNIVFYNTHIVDSSFNITRRDNGAIPDPGLDLDLFHHFGVGSSFQMSTIVCNNRARIDISQGTGISKIIAIRDQGGVMAREYWADEDGGGSRPTILNWKGRNVNNHDNVVDGDIAIHKNGTGDVYLAYHDAGTWRAVQLTGLI